MSECNGNCATCNSSTLFDYGTRKTFTAYPPDFCFPTNAVLNLTNECTHRCKMCFVDFNPRRMSFEVADAAVQFVINNCKEVEKYGDKKNPSIIFFGGEPLLEYDSIIVPLIHKYGKQITWAITTNGLLLDEDKIDFFRQNEVNILMSFDGDKITQNLQRPLKNGQGSFEANVKNIPYYVLRYPHSEMRATVTKESIPYFYENFLFAEKMGFYSCDFVMDSRVEIEYTEQDKRNLMDQMDKIATHIITKLILGHEDVIQFNTLIKAFTTLDIISKNPSFNNEVYRCGTGITSVGVGTDGKLYPCQEESSTLSDDIGTVFTGIDKDKHWQHVKTYMGAIDFLGRHKEVNLFNLFLLNQICPNRLLQGYDIGQGVEIMSAALFNSALRLLQNHSKSPIPRVYKYFYEGGRRD